MSASQVAMDSAKERQLPGQWRSGCWLFILGVLVTLSANPADGQHKYELQAATNYTLFTGPIELSFTIPFNVTQPEGIVEVVALRDGSVITYLILPPQVYTGVFTINCGTIDHAGQYVFMLRKRQDSPVLVESNILTAFWPPATISLPQAHTALTTAITVSVNVDKTECESEHPDSMYFIEVVYYGTNETFFNNRPEPKQYVFRERVKRLLYLQHITKELSCDLLDQGGVYQARIQSIYDEDQSIARSVHMFVGWSSEYSLSAARSIFPCVRSFDVQYTHPVCSGNQDKIRMYQQMQVNGSLASPIELVYRTETRAKQEKTHASFSCQKFEQGAYGYCFKYVSIARNGAVSEQEAICVPTKDIPVIDGKWSEWSTWSDCSVTCGLGKNNRYRTCDNPPPSQGGMFCQGEQVQYQDCESVCIVSTTPAHQYSPDPTCLCGCEMLNTKGTIVTARCPGSSVWTIHAQRNHKIRLHFEVFNVIHSNRDTWIKIRNGDTMRDELVVQSLGGSKPKDIISSKSAMLIEFYSPHEWSPFSLNEGFVAHYNTFVDNSTVLVTGDEPTKGRSFWESTVTIVGISLCAIIIIASVAFACHNRRMKKHRQKLIKAQAHQALLSNGEVPNSPAHSPTSLQGSNNISFSDAVGTPTKRDYIKAKGLSSRPPGSPIQRKLQKKHQTMSPVPGGREVSQTKDSRKSSQSSRKDSAGTPGSLQQVPSPYALNAESGDYYHDPSMFRVSPNPPEDSYSRSHRHNRRQSPNSPHSPPISPTRGKSASHGSRSPTKSMGSMRSGSPGSRQDRRTREKLSPNAPLADLEDMSPCSHTSPSHKLYSQQKPKGKMAPINENIPLDSYKSHRGPRSQKYIEETPLEQRPPVEGRDSLTRKQQYQDPKKGSTVKTGTNMPDSKPYIKPLPLRDVQRPDGQSPENKPTDPTPNSQISEMSPLFNKNTLFPNQSRTPSEAGFIEQEFEYDDYMPELPGSYFTMDPHAYTLTWSQQAPWAQQKAVSHAGSMASIRTTDTSHTVPGDASHA